MCFGYQLGLNLENTELIDFCGEKIAKSKTIFCTDSFKRCDKGTLEQILQLGLICKGVVEFDACLTWAKYACEQNGLDATQPMYWRNQLGDCLKLIRFSAMKIEEFSRRHTLHK